jgi:hypothetical protein
VLFGRECCGVVVAVPEHPIHPVGEYSEDWVPILEGGCDLWTILPNDRNIIINNKMFEYGLVSFGSEHDVVVLRFDDSIGGVVVKSNLVTMPVGYVGKGWDFGLSKPLPDDYEVVLSNDQG